MSSTSPSPHKDRNVSVHLKASSEAELHKGPIKEQRVLAWFQPDRSNQNTISAHTSWFRVNYPSGLFFS